MKWRACGGRKRTYDASNDAEATGIGDCSGKFGTSGNIHASKHDGVVDLEEVSDRGSDLLCKTVSTCYVSGGGAGDKRGEAMMS